MQGYDHEYLGTSQLEQILVREVPFDVYACKGLLLIMYKYQISVSERTILEMRQSTTQRMRSWLIVATEKS